MTHAKGTVHTLPNGFYLVQVAVSLVAVYLSIELLIEFADVLLPFIFAVIITLVLEPLKKLIGRTLQQIVVRTAPILCLTCCLDNTQRPTEEGDYRGIEDQSTGEEVYNTRTGAASPSPGIKKLILIVSIICCLAFTGKLLWIVVSVFVRSGFLVSGNLEFYKGGAVRLKRWFQTGVKHMDLKHMDYGSIVDDVLEEMEDLGTIVTGNILYCFFQGIVTFIFLIYMLWSPVNVRSGTNQIITEAYNTTMRYVTVKCLISAFVGGLTALILVLTGLDLPVAFGLLAFLANFLPGIGSPVASILPCVLAIIDVRKTPPQVAVAFVMMMVMHFCIDFVVEPVFFGMSVEIHSVIVMLGIWFFYQVWGVPGMLLSVPILAVFRIMMRSLRHSHHHGGDDAITMMASILEGRWMSNVGDRPDAEEIHFDVRHDQPLLHPGALSQEGYGGEGSVALQDRHESLDVADILFKWGPGQQLSQFYSNYPLMCDIAILSVVLAVAIAL